LSSADMDVRRQTLALITTVIGHRNVRDVVMMFKKELQHATQSLAEGMSTEDAQVNEYRQLLIQSIHTCALRQPDVATDVVHALVDSVSDMGGAAAAEVMALVREVAETLPDLRAGIVQRLLDAFPSLHGGKVIRGAIWVLGEYCADADAIDAAWGRLRGSLGE